MKTREVSKVLKAKIPVEDKKKLLDKEVDKSSKVKKAVGIATIAIIATGVTKIVSDKIKERKLIKEIEEKEEADFWEDYYEDFENELTEEEIFEEEENKTAEYEMDSQTSPEEALKDDNEEEK